MAVDTPKRVLQNRKSHKKTTPHATNPYLTMLHELYTFLARRTDSKFNQKVAHRLTMSLRNRPPLSLRRLIIHQRRNPEQIFCIVATVTDDIRVQNVPRMTVCALRFTDMARRRITAAGGECITFDQLALRAPLGENCALFQGHRSARKAERHFGRAPGLPGSTTEPLSNPKAKYHKKC